MQFDLVPHPTTQPGQPVPRLWVTVDHAGAFGAVATTNIWFGIGAPAHRFVLREGEPERADDLWQTTCFEAFLGLAGKKAYREWNFAPSGQWAAYDFKSYRKGMTKPEIGPPPYVRVEDNLTWWALGATITVEAEQRWDLGLSAVLEEKDGTKSYWALAHHSAKPDFHARDCFVAALT